VGVELDLFRAFAEGVIEQFACHFDSFKNGCGGAGAGGIFESDAVKGDTGGEDLIQTVDVEFRGMGISFAQIRSQPHHRHSDLMFQTVFGDGAAGDFQIADVVQRVEVADGGNAVFFEQFGMQIDNITGLAGKSDHIDAAGKGLQIDIGTDGLAPFVHHFKSIFLAIEVESLETGTAADFDVVDTGFDGGIESGQEIFSFDTGAETGLEAVTERTIHKFDFFHWNTFITDFLFSLALQINGGMRQRQQLRLRRVRHHQLKLTLWLWRLPVLSQLPDGQRWGQGPD